MNTCAECRFWRDSDLKDDFFLAELKKWPGEWKQCEVRFQPTARIKVAALYAEDDALLTRSDFGCVQFEPKAVEGVTPGTHHYTGVRIDAPIK